MVRPNNKIRLFPYTTLFRSLARLRIGRVDDAAPARLRADGEVGHGAVRHGRGPHDERAELEGVGGFAGLDRPDPQREHPGDRKSTRLNSSHPSISYAVFCLK